MDSIHSDAMVCAECFRAQNEDRSSRRCYNAKCHFYCLPNIGPEENTVFGSSARVTPTSAANFLSYRERDSYKSMGSTDSALGEDDLWAYTKPPGRKHPKSVAFAMDTHLDVPGSFNAAPSRPHSVSDIGQTEIGVPWSHKYRSRMLSVPAQNEAVAAERQFLDVDETFYHLHAPPRGAPYSLKNEYTARRGASDVDSGVYSPFSRPASSDFWLEPPRSGSGTPLSDSNDTVFNMSLLSAEMPAIGPISSIQKSVPTRPSPSPPPPPPSLPQIENSLLKKFLPLPSNGPGQSDSTYSRKVFLGGLPPDLDQEDIKVSFQQYGPVTIDWPHKVHSRSTIPPKGYAFLLFQDECSVHKLVLACVSEGDKMFTYINYLSATGPVRKKVQIKPWRIADSCHTVRSSQPVDCRKAVFVGGVPRPLRACELAEVMADKFGPVSFVAIDCDVDLKYPKGAGCVVFTTHSSFIAAVSSRFMQLSRAGIEKKIELKPYILDDQLCDECHGVQSNGKPAPFFCGSVTCLHYYCEQCWATVHSLPGRQSHRPMLKEIGDRDKL